jgi:ElaB/YqjD/DUF883 family membrane-anchored ribosome-binding protein
MADRNDASSSITSQGAATGRVGSTANLGGERATNVVVEFVDAARSAAESLLEEQRRRAAEQVSSIAAALRSAAQSLDQSQNAVIAHYTHQAAHQIESFSHTVRARRWNEIVADTEDFARRQPTWFVLGAVATGFLVGRFLWASMDSRRYGSGATGELSRSETTRTVTAAVSSGTDTGTAGTVGYGAGASGAMEAR